MKTRSGWNGATEDLTLLSAYQPINNVAKDPTAPPGVLKINACLGLDLYVRHRRAPISLYVTHVYPKFYEDFRNSHGYTW